MLRAAGLQGLRHDGDGHPVLEKQHDQHEDVLLPKADRATVDEAELLHWEHARWHRCGGA